MEYYGVDINSNNDAVIRPLILYPRTIYATVFDYKLSYCAPLKTAYSVCWLGYVFPVVFIDPILDFDNFLFVKLLTNFVT